MMQNNLKIKITDLQDVTRRSLADAYQYFTKKN
jgi:hypothetical protein